MKPFVLVGGHVISKTDGDRHYVSPQQLARLYGLSLRECCLFRDRDHWEWSSVGLPADCVVLVPLYSGDYDAEGVQAVITAQRNRSAMNDTSRNGNLRARMWDDLTKGVTLFREPV